MTGAPKRTTRSSGLKDQANSQIAYYFETAEKSDKPEIVALALKLAEKESGHQQRLSKRLHPLVAALLSIAVCAGAVWICAHDFKLQSVAVEVCVRIIAFILAAALLLFMGLMSGKLSESGFAKLFAKLGTWIKSLWPKFGNEKLP